MNGQHSYDLDNVRGLHNFFKTLMNVATKLSERRLCGVGCHSGPCDSFHCLGHFKNVYDDDDDDNDGSDGTKKTISGIFQVNGLLK